ncbi:MAG: 50S ribosomal protein L21 [Candidatus Omnitrophota bacterium]|nr:MAG: 50S ribosomal protein L21 [Candidatus Omnitrophota bacterium]
MYAIVEVGSRQYKVAEKDEILIEKAVPARTHKLVLDKVLLTAKGKDVKVGNPYVKNAKLECEVLAHTKDKKKIAFKFRRRKSSQSKRGHRQKQVLIKVKEIVTKSA